MIPSEKSNCQPEYSLQKNVDRFTGFSNVYDRARPRMPDYPVRVIRQYLEREPDTVIDLGSGTGLSAMIWQGNCKQIIGIEPNEDMLNIAKSREGEGISFRRGVAQKTGLPSSCADVVVCSQSFHWMEPFATLQEIDRLLKPGGVFATVDCDWPPVTKWQAEQAYLALYEKARYLEKTFLDTKDSFIRYNKNKHLENIQNSGYFRYCREIVFSNTETFTSQRLLQLMLSQGSIQALLKRHSDVIQQDIERFQNRMEEIFGRKDFEVDFCYRMRIAVK